MDLSSFFQVLVVMLWLKQNSIQTLIMLVSFLTTIQPQHTIPTYNLNVLFRCLELFQLSHRQCLEYLY